MDWAGLWWNAVATAAVTRYNCSAAGWPLHTGLKLSCSRHAEHIAVSSTNFSEPLYIMRSCLLVSPEYMFDCDGIVVVRVLAPRGCGAAPRSALVKTKTDDPSELYYSYETRINDFLSMNSQKETGCYTSYMTVHPCPARPTSHLPP